MAVRTIATDLKLTGEKEFNDQMKAVNSNLKTLKSDMAAVSAEFDGNANSVEALTAKQKILQDSVDQQRVKVDALRAMYEKVADASGENSAAADKWKQQLNYATVALAKETAALEKNSEALDEARDNAKSLEKANDNLADSNDDVAKSADKARINLGGLAQGMGTLVSASAAGAASIGTGGMALLGMLTGFAQESAETARAASEAGEMLSDSQKAWLDYAGRLDSLDKSAANAKSALGGILLPVLGDLSTVGTAFLNHFSREMEAASGDTERQAKILSEYIVKGARLIKDKLPEYLQTGKELLSALGEGLKESGPELLDTCLDLGMDMLDFIIANAPKVAEAALPVVQQLAEGLIERAPDLIDSAATLIANIATYIGDHAPDLIDKAGVLLDNIADGIEKALPEIGTAAGNIIAELVTYLTDEEKLKELLDGAWELGKKIGSAILEGWSNMWYALDEGIPGLKEGMLVASNYASTGILEVPLPSHASGLDYVPYDGYIASLHKGEKILTSSEAANYRRNGSGNEPTKVVNLNFSANRITESDVHMIVDIVNRELGDNL